MGNGMVRADGALVMGAGAAKALAYSQTPRAFGAMARRSPFTGSGTFGQAALELGRRFLGAERDPHWRRVAERRLAQVPLLLL